MDAPVYSMKMILSRKGFDSACGGAASPILPDGRMVSLPIPEPSPKPDSRRYTDLGSHAGIKLDRLLDDLTGGRVRRKGRWEPADRAHLDPDLDRRSVPRSRGWQPAFGQWSAAQTHLRKEGVGVGDVFLFFGWFHRLRLAQDGRRYEYDPTAPDLHVCYGWLQVGQILTPVDLPAPPTWLAGHPHLPPYGKSDHVYLATERLRLPGWTRTQPGGGIFGRYHPSRCLTEHPAHGKGQRSVWRLPGWFHPGGGKRPLSYHGTEKNGRFKRWLLDPAWPEHTRLDSAKQGQEFVLDTRDYPEAVPWLVSLFGR